MTYLPTVVLILSAFVAGSYQLSECGNVNAKTLQLLIVAFRQGDRTPRLSFPNDKWLSYWDQWDGIDRITQKGTKQIYDVGKWTRKCYDSFLGDKYSLRDVYIRSTDTEKSLKTAVAYIAGVYPPKSNQIWDDTDTNPLAGLWQPASVHTVPFNEDYLLNARITCPVYQALINKRWKNLGFYNQIRNSNQPLLDFLAVKAGFPTPGDLKQISNSLSDWAYNVQQNGFAFPDWMNSTTVDKLISWKEIWMLAETGIDQAIRLGVGQLIATIQDIFVNKSKGLQSYKQVIYSGHEFDVVGLLAAYGHNYSTAPRAASLFTELHYDADEDIYFVKAFYRDRPTANATELSIRNCGIPCYLDDFITILNPLRDADRKTTCTA